MGTKPGDLNLCSQVSLYFQVSTTYVSIVVGGGARLQVSRDKLVQLEIYFCRASQSPYSFVLKKRSSRLLRMDAGLLECLP